MPATKPVVSRSSSTIFGGVSRCRRSPKNRSCSLSRRAPMASNFSRPKPIGSIRLWQPAQLLLSVCSDKPFAVGLRLGLGHRRQIRIHARRRIGNVLAQKLLADEQAARRRRRLVGTRTERQEQRLAEQTGALGVGREVELSRTPSPAPERRRLLPDRRSRSRSRP